MTVVLGTSGDTTGSVVAAWTSAAQVTAALNVATNSNQGAMSVAEYNQLQDAATKLNGPAASEASMVAYSAVIDLTITGTYAVVLPAAIRAKVVSAVWEIRSTNTVSVAPTFSIGSNSASFNDIAASQTPAGFTTQAVETQLTSTLINPIPVKDLTTSGIKVIVTGGATATALTARLIVEYAPLPV